MQAWEKIKGEFVDIIEWTDDSLDTLVWRFPRYHNQIKYGAQLTVRETQVAVFVNVGRIADVFRPGMYALETRNLPVLSTLQGWKFGFDSPFRAEVYFVSTRQFTDIKWGTRNPVIVRDSEFGPVRLRAFGTYAMRVGEPAVFVREIAGTSARFTLDGVAEQLRSQIVTRFSDHIAGCGIPVLDIARNYDEISAVMRNTMAPEFVAYGLELTRLLVENVSLPEDVERAIDKRTSMGIVGDVDRFVKFQSGVAMEGAAANPGGGASSGIGMGIGFAMGGQIGQAFNGQRQVEPASEGGPRFHVQLDGAAQGPFDLAAVSSMVQQGRVARDTLVWRLGTTDWVAAERVSELAQAFGQLPPPLPGAGR
jgi:membrane protease subunit (stomatin/prohibitin family)